MFNVGDKVRCVGQDVWNVLGLGEEYTISDCDGAIVWVNGHLNGFSCPRFELIEKGENKLKPKEMLKSGMRVKTRKGTIYMVVLDFDDEGVTRAAFINENGWNPIDLYDDNLNMVRFNHPNSDIMEIYPVRYNSRTNDTKGCEPFWVRDTNQEKIEQLERQIATAKQSIEVSTKLIEELKGNV